MASWVHIPKDSDFSLHNLPYGVFSTSDLSPRIGVAIGNSVLDLKGLAEAGIFDGLKIDLDVFQQSTLNDYASLGHAVHRRVRTSLQELLQRDTTLGSQLRDNDHLCARALVPVDQVKLHLPIVVGDYTDHFLGLPHAKTVSTPFTGTPSHRPQLTRRAQSAGFLRPGATIEQLIPSFWDAPAAYHGRSSTVVVSGTPIPRPKGQISIDGKSVASLCQKLDFEVEFACVISKGNEFGVSIPIEQAEEHIFGFVLLNDWSARDFQKNEHNPFTSKNFATSISPWVVPFDALEPFRAVVTHEDVRTLPLVR